MREYRVGTPGAEVFDQFLSEDDNSLREMSHVELIRAWNDWLAAAQSTNAFDAEEYSHSAFLAPYLWKTYGIEK